MAEISQHSEVDVRVTARTSDKVIEDESRVEEPAKSE